MEDGIQIALVLSASASCGRRHTSDSDVASSAYLLRASSASCWALSSAARRCCSRRSCCWRCSSRRSWRCRSSSALRCSSLSRAASCCALSSCSRCCCSSACSLSACCLFSSASCRSTCHCHGSLTHVSGTPFCSSALEQVCQTLRQSFGESRARFSDTGRCLVNTAGSIFLGGTLTAMAWRAASTSAAFWRAASSAAWRAACSALSLCCSCCILTYTKWSMKMAMRLTLVTMQPGG